MREEGYKDATINRFCQVLGQSYKLAIERKHLASGPIVKHLSEIGNERKGFFTETEIRCVIANLPEHLKDFVLFAYITGMRRGEVQSLRWSDVQDDAITLRPEHSKNSEGRTIPLEDELVDLIERRKAARKVETKDGSVLPPEYIFHLNGRPIASFRKAWATACKFANVPGRLFHDLRRCAARNLLASGVPQTVAMKITGHKTDSMFRRYAIVTVEQQREALRAARASMKSRGAVMDNSRKTLGLHPSRDFPFRPAPSLLGSESSANPPRSVADRWKIGQENSLGQTSVRLPGRYRAWLLAQRGAIAAPIILRARKLRANLFSRGGL